MSILAGVTIIGVIIALSVRGFGIPMQGIGATTTPATSVLQTPTPTAFAQTPTLDPTQTQPPAPTPTETWTASPAPSPTPSATPSPAATSTATATGTAMASPAPTHTPLPRTVPTATPTVLPTVSPPVLLEPQSGKRYPNPITFRWDGPLNEGEAFQVTTWHVESGKQVQTSPMTEREWTYGLHKDLVGEWRWVVWLVKEGQVLAISEEWFFWLDPHQGPGPREWPTRHLPGDTPTPKPTPPL